MSPSEQLADYVREGLRHGTTPEALRQALGRAGWSAREVDQALGAWLPPDAALGAVPVPRPRPYFSARDAILYGMLFIALGNVIYGTVSVGWRVIEQLIPDISDFYDRPRRSARWPIALLVVFAPLFAWLNHRVMRAGRDQAGQRRSLIRRWFASVTVILASLTLLGDLVAVIYALLNGELTARFIAKAAWLAVLAALVLAYLRDDVDVR